MDTPEIHTSRLRLSRLVMNDAPAVYEYRSNPDVYRYQSFEPTTLVEVEHFIRALESNSFNNPDSWFQFGIRMKDSDLLIGDLGTYFHRNPQLVEIGFTISPTYQKNGYGTESVSGILKYLFESLDKHHVIASVDPQNHPSVVLLKRAGMRQEAYFRKSLWFKGEWVDDMIFGILQSDWKG